MPLPLARRFAASSARKKYSKTFSPGARAQQREPAGARAGDAAFRLARGAGFP